MAGRLSVKTTMFLHPVTAAMAMASRIAKSSMSVDVSLPVETLTEVIWCPFIQRTATATVCHREDAGTLASVAHRTL